MSQQRTFRGPGGERLDELFTRVADWCATRFAGQTWEVKAKHLKEEAQEVLDAEGDGEELADIIFLVADMARTWNIDLYEAVEHKLEKNQASTWLPADADGFVRKIDSRRVGRGT